MIFSRHMTSNGDLLMTQDERSAGSISFGIVEITLDFSRTRSRLRSAEATSSKFACLSRTAPEDRLINIEGWSPATASSTVESLPHGRLKRTVEHPGRLDDLWSSPLPAPRRIARVASYEH